MEITNKRKNITIGIVAVIVVLILIGAYKFDNRFENPSDSGSNLNFGTSSLDLPGATSTAPAVNSNDINIPTGYIRLESVVLETKSNVSTWSTYSNKIYNFSIKHPANAEVRKFIDGKNEDYGIGLTFKNTGGRFTEKYFEITTEVGATTACDALLDNSSSKVALVDNQSFIQREYNDGTSHVIEFTSKISSVCYHAYARLNNPTNGKPASPAGDATTKSEAQLLLNIMSTFKFTK